MAIHISDVTRRDSNQKKALLERGQNKRTLGGRGLSGNDDPLLCQFPSHNNARVN